MVEKGDNILSSYLSVLSHVRLFAAPWFAAHQATLCMKFLRKNAQLLVRNCFLQLHGRNEVQMNQVFYFMGFPGVHSVCSAAQSCPTLCDPMDCSPPGSSVQGILQARILEQVAVPFSRGSIEPRSALLQILYHLRHQGSPQQVKTKPNNYMCCCA